MAKIKRTKGQKLSIKKTTQKTEMFEDNNVGNQNP
jgi:hypothetical protein